MSLPDPASAKIGGLKGEFWGGAVIFLFFAFAVYHTYRLRETLPLPLNGAGDTVRELSYVVLFGVALLRMRVLQDIRYAVALPVSMALLLGWCWLSVSWAIDPMIALRRLALSTVLIWTTYVSVKHAGFDLTVKAMRWVLTIVLIMNYLSLFMSPLAVHRAGDGVSTADLVGAWRGITSQKNFAGALCAMTIIVYIFFGSSVGRIARWSILLGSAYFLYRTESKTSMGVLALSLALAAIYSALGPRTRRLLFPAGILLGAILLYAASQVNLYDPRAFSGRSQIWLTLLDYSQHHLWLGSGFGSFWDIGANDPVYQYARGWLEDITSAHNGYLDVLVQLGLPGLLLTVLAMVLIPAYRLLMRMDIPRRQGAFLFACLAFCVGHNFTESTILTTDYMVETFLLVTLALISVVTSPAMIAGGVRSRWDVWNPAAPSRAAA